MSALKPRLFGMMLVLGILVLALAACGAPRWRLKPAKMPAAGEAAAACIHR